jgi:hypothetical protein
MAESRTGPCPFRFCASPNTTPWEMEVENIDGSVRKIWRVICRQCGAQGPWGASGENGKYLAIERWNGRALP